MEGAAGVAEGGGVKSYALKCHCNRQEVHGFEPPATNLQTCVTARAIRAGCRDFGCRFELVEQEAEFDDVDRLRLGLRDERRLA
jgi:hypothetical protein